MVFCLYLIGFSGFQSNVVQFGLDQLQEASSEELSIFLHWFVWTDAFGRLCIKVYASIAACHGIAKTGLTFVPGGVLIILTALACLSYNKLEWFNIEPAMCNPYKTVFRVLKFAKKHSYALQRSAFTYTGDENPSRIDYAKAKYGGPFTTEEVEDVKTFLRILGLLLCIGPIFTTEVAMSDYFVFFGLHTGRTFFFTCTTQLKSGSVSPLITTLSLPIYMYFMRVFALHRRNAFTLLQHLGLGISISACGMLSMLLLDAIGHYSSGTDQCMFTIHIDPPPSTLHLHTPLLLIPIVLNGIGPPLVYITVLEFILAQSPHSMKGFLVGVFYAIKGVFLILGNITIAPFILPYRHTNGSTVSCGTGYYLVVTIIAVGGLLLYVLAARRYKYWQRGEQPYNQMHVEEYYERVVAAETNQESP